MSLDKYSIKELEQEIARRHYSKEQKLDGIYITSYCIDQFMKRSGAKNRLKAHKSLCRMYLGAVPVQMKGLERMYRLLNNNCQEAVYFEYNGWIVVIVDKTMKTVYKKNEWFI